MAEQNTADDNCTNIINDDDSNSPLPIEIVIHIMSYLTESDRISAGFVCREWHEASLSFKFIDKQLVVISREDDNIQFVMKTLSKSQRLYYHFLFKEVEVRKHLPIWNKFGAIMRSLILVGCDLSERHLINILKSCKELRVLHINACRECLMSGRLLDDKNDVEELFNNFQSLIELSLASNRYLSDALFNRFVSICPNLESLILTDCQISFHPGVYKRFYPVNKVCEQASESLLTFFNVLTYIQKQAKKLKHLSFGSTLIDSTALTSLSEVDGLNLESLTLNSCDQLTNAGLRNLINQTKLRILNISFCTRVTDASLLCICKNLHNIEILNVRRCRALTNYGISRICLLKKLKELDISECDQLTGTCITHGLCRETLTEEDNYLLRLDEAQYENMVKVDVNDPILENKNDNVEIFHNKCLEKLSANALNLDEKSIESIASCFSILKYLDIGYCFSAVTDKTIQKIFKELTLLRRLKIDLCDKVSDAGLTGMGADNRTNLVDAPTDRSSETTESKLRIRLGSKAEKEIVSDANRKREVMEMCEDPMSPIDFDNIPGYSLIRLQGLRILELMGCNRVTDVSLKHAFTFPELQILDIGMCQQITHVGLDYLTKNNTAIEELNLSECHNITDKGIYYVAFRLHRLKRLHIRGCSQLTNQSLDYIKLYAKNLQYLDVNSCRGMTSSGLEGLSHLHIAFCDALEAMRDLDLPLPPF